ncbi:hypothetical protein FZC78_04795 [Rossellomorea vietnamensis]|uniref:Uncharacterized protein n=1 Tax=Rossellomorea vietnamensis TaxID=218284 RepID=A0A5D4NZB0_9BACI|nr:hypothetical protein [Rossellomorea vietnamensis]TYS18824.1 hypothetical protein FZC78_04795 [Rossellomorea vietnamensis]
MNKVDAVSSGRIKANWGCFSWAVILVIAPIITGRGGFLYDRYFKERLLEASSSPNDQFSIEIVEKGSAFWFGPSESESSTKEDILIRPLTMTVHDFLLRMLK